MDNPNPIYYRDLITPDDSIKNLIAQLDELIAKYEAAKQKIQGAAADAAKSMQNLSGATEDQRKNISGLVSESEKLYEAYKKSNDAESETYRRRQQVIAAVKEQQRIDKLIVEINNSKEGSYKRLSAQYRLNKIRLNEMSAEERNLTQQGRQLEKETRAIYEEMSRLQKATGNYTLEVGHYENALRGLPGPINQVFSGLTNMGVQLGAIAKSGLPLGTKALRGFSVALAGTIGILLMFVRGLTGAFNKIKEFEQANADLSTILGVNKTQMKALTNSALELGRSTEYTASQVTSLQTELAKLGFTQIEIMNMQKSILQFATAVGTDLASAAKLAGATLRAFELDSTQTEDVLGTLAVATNKSALSFSMLETAMSTIAPVAHAYGLSLKDTTALLGTLANAGFDASTAATATRNILLNLADANGKLAKTLGGSVSTFDEIIDALIKLRDSGVDLNTTLDLTDKRSVAAFNAFLSGAEASRELRAELENVGGELDRIQSQRLETVEGSIKLLQSAWEGFILSMSNSTGTIKRVIDTLTAGVEGLIYTFRDARVNEYANMQVQTLQDVFDRFGSEYLDEYIKNREADYDKLIEDAGRKRRKQLREERDALRVAVDKVNTDLSHLTFAQQLDQILRAYEDKVARYQADMSLSGREAEQLSEQARIQYEKQRKEIIKAESNAIAARKAQAEKARQEESRKAEEARKAEEKKAAEAAKKKRIADRRAVVEAINTEISIADAGTEKMLQLRLDKVEAERQLELEQNRQKAISQRQDEEAINAKFDKKALEAKKQFANEVSKITVQRLQAEQQAVQLEISITEDGTERMLELRLANIEKQRQIELENNKQKAENIRQSEQAINAKYDKLLLKEAADFNQKLAKRDLEALQSRQEAEFDLLTKNERQKTLFRLEQEKARLAAVLKMNEDAATKMTEDEVAAIRATIAGIEKETKKLPYNNMYELLGLDVDSDQQSALNTAIDSVKDSVNSLIDSWVEAADAAVNAANKQVDAIQKTLDAQIEARNAGYANEVETAQKELELAKKNQESALKEKQKAQKAQSAIDSITQASSLVTASANIWSSLSGIPIVGPGLAITAIATMWGSFLAAKIKAAQVTAQTEQYGHGTVELLQGGSHASGNDIDLGTKPDGTRRRAEGGEYFAIINKRNSRRYGRLIPDVINAFNDGTFADKYQRANATMDGYAISLVGGATDVSGLEKDVAAIREQGDRTQYVDGNGNIIIRYKNLTRKIYKN